MLPSSPKLKFILVIFVLGGSVHLILDQFEAYDNFDIGIVSSYLKDDSDPMNEVLENSASHIPTDETSFFTIGSTVQGNDSHSTTIVPKNVSNIWSNEYSMTGQSKNLTDCPLNPGNLVGPIRVWMDEPELSALEKLYPDLEPGGHSKPTNCTARHRVAVIIPYRNRAEHLRVFLHNMHSFMKKQQLDFSIIVVEQVANQTFNRAKLMNVGHVEGMKLYPWECFIFHDVDLLPEDDRNLYSCPRQPRHMSVAVDKFGYKLPYGSIFGGISALTVEQLRKINGFSNDYWGWGGEDDDLSTRVKLAGFQISRYPAKVARYKMIKHGKEGKSNPINPCRYKIMAKTNKRWQKDGLNTLHYKVLKVELLPLYTHIMVDLLEDESKILFRKEIRC